MSGALIVDFFKNGGDTNNGKLKSILANSTPNDIREAASTDAEVRKKLRKCKTNLHDALILQRLEIGLKEPGES